ncbi:glycosyltransferase [Streptomyces sp. NBC_00659]|uniref:glycosyltransferase family 2 protein n=1 Tax=Streptomyces sp. NBC_00659 TaxID=2903669 RepID=UPI002E343057|nr:glycosyltransferase family 2 protein [Streptomyces sp. NBC_00659]
MSSVEAVRAVRSAAQNRQALERHPCGSINSDLLPVPPSDSEKYSYVGRRLRVLTVASLVSISCLALSQFRLFSSAPLLRFFYPLLAFTVLYYVISLWVNLFSRDFDLSRHQKLVGAWRPDVYPSVDVFLPVCGEPVEILHNTWTHVRALAAHYPGVCEPFVLDDSASPELQSMADEFGFRYATRSNLGWFKKAGNLHFGFEQTHGTYILVLDADFAPRTDLLHELLPYLAEDERLAIVQSPQYFRVLDAQNWIERGAGAVQELFYRAVQVSRQSNDGAICVGSCAVYRRAALHENGGTTLIEHSEDVHTGFDLRSLGWDLRYVPIALSAGVCPDNADSFFRQQYRWCAGSMSMLCSSKFWRAKMRISSRLCYLSGFLYYIHTALFTFVAPLIPILLLLAFPEKPTAETLWLVLPSVLYTTTVFPLWHKVPYRLEAWAARMMYGWAHTFAIWDILRGRHVGWQATGSCSAKLSGTERHRIGMWSWGGGTALLWVGSAAWRTLTLDPVDFVVLLSSGLFYAVVVARALLQPRAMGTP